MKDIKISITIETIIKIFLSGIAFWLIYTFSDLLLIIVTSIILASAFEPLVKSIQNQKIPRVLAVSFVYIFITAAIASIIIFFSPTLTEQATNLSQNLSEYSERLDLYITEKTLDNTSIIGNILSQGNITTESLHIQNFFDISGDSLKEIFSSFTAGLSTFLLIMVLSFYFAVQEHSMENFLKIITPARYRKYSINLWKRAQTKITYWIQGQFILGVVIGLMVYVGLTILGVPQAGLLAILAGFAELIPVVGQILAAIPAIFIGFVDGGVSFALMIISMYFIIQFIEGQIIYPLMVKKLVGVPSIIVILSLIIGAQLFGFLGVIIAIPLAAVAMELVRDMEKRQEKNIKVGKEKEVDLIGMEKK